MYGAKINLLIHHRWWGDKDGNGSGVRGRTFELLLTRSEGHKLYCETRFVHELFINDLLIYHLPLIYAHI